MLTVQHSKYMDNYDLVKSRMWEDVQSATALYPTWVSE